MLHGACKDINPAVFFPHSGSPSQNLTAKRICDSCIQKSRCLSYAVRYGIEDGVWGGTSGKERRGLIRARNRALRLDSDSTRPPDSAYG